MPQKVGESSSEDEPAIQESYKVGDKVQLGDQTLTVNKAERNWTEGGQFAYEPEAGKEFVLVGVTITNEGSSPISFNAFDFQMQDSNGTQKDYTFAPNVPNPLNSGNLAAGGKVEGNLAFEVPKDDQGLKLLFTPDFWTGNQIVVEI